MKTSNVDDAWFLRIVDEMATRGPTRPVALVHEIGLLTGLPRKIILSKARKLIRRDLLDGCYCGCRGDFCLTPSGREFLLSRITLW